jgi:protein TonB
MDLACAVSAALHLGFWACWPEARPEPVVQPAQVIEVSLITVPSQSTAQPQQTHAQDMAAPMRPVERQPQKPIARKVVKTQPRSVPKQAAESKPLPEARLDIPMAAAPSSGTAVEAMQTPPQVGSGQPQPMSFVEAVYRSPSLKNPPTQYPPLAIARQWEGRVILRVQVFTDGLAGQVYIEHGSGHPLLDDAAAQQVKNWHFIPARKGDQPVDSWVKVPVEFKLKN